MVVSKSLGEDRHRKKRASGTTQATTISKAHEGVHVVPQQKQIQLGTMRLRVRSLASLSGLRILHCPELWCRLKMWLRSVLLWLWYRPAAVAPTGPLAWESPYAAGAALKKQTNKKKMQKQRDSLGRLGEGPRPERKPSRAWARGGESVDGPAASARKLSGEVKGDEGGMCPVAQEPNGRGWE